jgi:hypothetical protein
LLEVRVDLAALIIGWAVAATEYAFDVLGAVPKGAEISRVGASAFDASGLKMSVVRCQLAIRTLGYFAFLVWGLRCDPALL